MNNLALKYAKELVFTSVRVQQLMDEKLFPDEEFENQKKKEIYEEAKYYHKAQHGLVRISKYVFQEAAMVMVMPLLHKASLFLEQSGITDPSLLHKKSGTTIITPILFEGVPQWVSLCNGQMKMITWDKTCNIISMMAPYGGDGLYKEKEIIFLLLTLFAGFGGIKKRGIKDKVQLTEIHTGNWGCGNFRNNKELIYLSQIYVADVLGIDTIVFHLADNQLMEKAIEKWKEIPDNLCFDEAVKLFTDYGFKWR